MNAFRFISPWLDITPSTYALLDVILRKQLCCKTLIQYADCNWKFSVYRLEYTTHWLYYRKTGKTTSLSLRSTNHINLNMPTIENCNQYAGILKPVNTFRVSIFTHPDCWFSPDFRYFCIISTLINLRSSTNELFSTKIQFYNPYCDTTSKLNIPIFVIMCNCLCSRDSPPAGSWLGQTLFYSSGLILITLHLSCSHQP